MDRIFAQAIAEKYFGIQASAHELPSERDQNFLLTSRDGEKFVLKIANRGEKREVLEAQNAMLGHLEEKVSFCPRVVTARSGEGIEVVEGQFVRVLSYLPGTPLAKVQRPSVELLYDLGRKLGQLDQSLQDFDHPGAHRSFHWDLAQGVQVVRQYGPQIKEDGLRELVLGFSAGSLNHLRNSVIHGDANDYNVLVEGNKVVGLIDFGDIVYSYTVGDLAVAVAYVILGKADPYAAAAPVIEGYLREFPLTKDELDAVWPLARLRLCMSVAIAAYQQAQQPENEYLGVSQALIAETLPRLM
ncbi:MAG TPA: phosphotransferase, partial [Pyrinomonadaceae bacterium]|nr:phosphotransferase [Pyrinomonadaceae bacterium]